MKVTVAWYGENRFVGWGGSGAPVLVNFPPGAGAAPASARETPAGVGTSEAGTAAAGAGVPAAQEGAAAWAGPASSAEIPAGPAWTAPGPSPMELTLIAAAACTGLDVVSLLGKMRTPFSGLEIEVNGERAPDHPRSFTSIEFVYRLRAGPAALPALERSVRLSLEKYCSVGHSLRAERHWRCEVV